MGFFSKSPLPTEALSSCALCNREYAEEMMLAELGICSVCGIAANSYLEHEYFPLLQSFEDKANSAIDHSTKIHYLHAMLDVLYTYKVKYQDNGVSLLTVDITESIDKIIDLISTARV